jgi:hypothetical protein
MLNFLRDDVPRNWRIYCVEVTDNVRVIDPKNTESSCERGIVHTGAVCPRVAGRLIREPRSRETFAQICDRVIRNPQAEGLSGHPIVPSFAFLTVR